MQHKFVGFLAGGLLLALGASPAYAAKVSVEVEGLSVTAPPTVVDTPGTVAKNGRNCPNGANIIGATDAFTKGDWDGSVDAVTRILSEDHPFAPNTPGWTFMINGDLPSGFGCTATVKDGDKLLWYVSAGSPHYRAPTGYSDPVLLDAPTAAEPGQAFTVTVTDTTINYDPADPYDTPQGVSKAPSSGATVTGGTGPVTTGADGKASVTVPGGPYTLVATKGNRAPARIAGCATNGHDGFCGTTDTPTKAPPPLCTTTGDDGLCGSPDHRAPAARLTGIPEGKHYNKGQGPRQLSGRVGDDPSGLAAVRLRLTRNDRSHCSTYDGKSERWKTLRRCGAIRGTWFSVGAKPDVTYLLPARLPRGRYVLDLEATDKAGNKAALARGTTRVVFTVA